MEAEEDKPRKRNLDSLEGTTSAVPPSRKKPRNAAVAIGSHVRKSFPGDNPGVPPRPLLGKVLSCCGRQYTIVFEDGRREALNLPETRQILLPPDALQEDPSEESLQRWKKLEQLCRSAVVANAPRTRSRKGRPDAAEPPKKNDDDDDDADAVAKAPDPVEVAGSSSTMPSSNLDDEDPDSWSDSCDSVRAPGSAEEDAAPRAPPLPPSSGDIDVPEDAVFYLFNVYSFLRSFSRQLFLSPFGFGDFVGALNCRVSNNLLDAVHLALLRTLRRHLEALKSDGSKLACMCLKCIDWNLLDVMTWPIFLVRYFSMSGHMKEVDGEVLLAGALEGEYYGLPVTLKLAMLQILCDDVLESAELGMELATRENMDEEKEIDINPAISCLESGPKRVHPRYAKTSACKNPGSLEETIITDELISISKGVEIDTKDLSVGQDGNSDDCRLCGMEGTLVCCDGCPSAYHSRCIGLNKASLPDGTWFCLECMVKKMGLTSSRVSFGIKGAELFGSDPFGRMFFGTCDYLLVLENLYKGNYIFRYYNRGDIMKVLQVLCSTREASSLCAGITRAISTYWEIPLTLDHFPHFRSDVASLTVDKDIIVCSRNHCISIGKVDGEDQEGNNHISHQKGEGEGEDQEGGIATCKEEDRDFSPQDNSCPNTSFANDTSVLMDASSLGTESIFNGLSPVKRLEDLEKKPVCFQQKAIEDTTSVAQDDYQLGDELSKSVGASNLSSDVYIGDSIGKDDGLNASPLIFKPYEYVNQYIPGEFAASAAANFAIAAAERNKVLETNPSAKERKNLAPIAALQLKSFCEASMHFLWPGTDKKIFDVLRERCGWCLACEAAATCKKGCLLNIALINTISGYSRSLGNFRPLKNGSHISSIATYILYMEASLSGLLQGPFLDAYHNVQWRKIVSEVSTIEVLKYLLLEFEKNIRRIVFSNDWLKPVDDWSSEFSNSQSGACILGSSQKRCVRGRRGRKRAALTESNHSDSDDDPGQIQWWCGGRLSKFVLRRGAIPAVLAKKSARQAGTREISGVFYNLKVPSTTREATWRAAVETSKNYSQLAFQVRYLDAHIRWRDISRPELTSLDGKGVDIEASAFRNAGIVDEKIVGNHTQYALAFGDQKHLPSRIMKNVLESELSMDGDRLWFSESFLPPYLIREYEEKKVASCMPSLCKGVNWLSIIPTIQHNDVQEDILSYLFHKGEKPVKCSCSSCKGDVPLRHALKCQNCGGPCHRNCLKISAIDMKTWMCTTCFDANPLKKDVGNSKTRVPTTKNQITSQDQMTPEVKIREQFAFGSSEQPANIEEISKRRSVSDNKSSKRKNNNKCLSHGLIWKTRKGGVEFCDPDFQTKNIILKGDVEMGNLIAPRCKLCTLPYNPNLMYIRCEKCKYWYHAESVELEEHRIVDLAGFKCPTCRRRCSPICPYADPHKKRQMKRNDMDGKQRKATQIASRTSSEPLECGFAVQSCHAEMEDTVVPPERIEQASTLMSKAPVNCSLPKAVTGSKGKLPVRRHVNNDIPADADTGHSELEEPGMLSTVKTEIKQEVDLQGFTSIQEANSSMGVDGMYYFNRESDYLTADGDYMDGNEINRGYQIYDSNVVGTEDMEYEPQTYFSFTELLASGSEQGDEMFDVDIPVEVPYDWHPPDSWDPSHPSGADDNCGVPQVVPPCYLESKEEQMEYDGLECQKCGSSSPPPDLCCEICGLTIHAHCSPWVEMEQAENNGRWRCGGCREWR